jgi:glutaredoxin
VNPSLSSTSPVEVLWRPGCPFCSRLRSGLRSAGIETVERNIWVDPEAAARVRALTGGDETVPTVVVGRHGLVNPSVSAVVAAVRAEFPEDADALVGAAAVRPSWSGWTGAALTIAAGLLWLALVLWRPTTTWHLAPVLVAGAWPWLLWQARPPSDSEGLVRLMVAAAVGFGAAGLATLAFSGADLLRGPTLPGFTVASTEALVLAAGTAVLAVLLGVVMRRTTHGVR